jgi:hypothetical protein
MVSAPMSERDYAHLGGTITGLKIAVETVDYVCAQAREVARALSVNGDSDG